MKNKFTGALVAAVFAMSFLVTGSSIAAQKPINLTFSIFFPPSHAHAKAAADYAKELERRSGGKVKISTFPGSTLISPDQAYDAVKKGIADMALSVFAYTRGRFPVMAAVDLPMGYKSGLQASRVASAFVREVNPEELQDTKVLLVHAHGPAVFMTKSPVRNMEDLYGMKIRASGSVTEVINALGGVPVAMPMGESYEALQKGVVQGILAPAEVLKGWKLAEVVDYITQTDAIGYTNAEFVVMNKKKWASLSDDVKKVFEEVSAEWVDVHGNIWDKIDQEGMTFAADSGKTIIRLDDAEKKKWREAMALIVKKYEDSTPNGAAYVQKVQELIKKFQ